MVKHPSEEEVQCRFESYIFIFFFRKFRIGYNEGKWNSLGYARRWLRRHNHANSSMVEHSKQFERRAFEAYNPLFFSHV